MKAFQVPLEQLIGQDLQTFSLMCVKAILYASQPLTDLVETHSMFKA